ncbi:MAG: PmoA family protein [Gemmataceae bacterium]
MPLTRLCTLLGLLVLALASKSGPAAETGEVKVEKNKDTIDFLIGKDLVSRYHYGDKVAKPYLWPLNAPGNVPLTRAWPMEPAKPGGTTDHVHQKSAWFCYGDVIPEGLELKHRIKGVEGVDFWSEAPGHGVIACIDVGDAKSDKNHGWIMTRNEWRTADKVKTLEETRTIHLYDLGEARLIVFDIDLQAGMAPVTFGDTKEGAFGVRVNDAIREDKSKGVIENAEGKKSERNCWGRISKWCDYSGSVDGKKVGLAILDDPSNPFPACWHSRGYGLMAANPFGRILSGFPAMQEKKDLVKLAKGDHLKLRYGILLHSGDAKEGKVEEHFAKFVQLK